MGADGATWLSYGVEKIIQESDNFGKGEPDGVVAPETANNGTGGTMVPMLTLGIPGDEQRQS